jgi:hypothetical protein
MEGLMRFLSLRAVFLLGFVVAMPVLALPPVARRIDELLYGPSQTDFGRVPATAPLSEELSQPEPARHVSPSRWDEPSPAAGSVATSGFNAPINPPSLVPSPPIAFTSPTTTNALNPNTESKIDERTISRLQQIRQRLEQLGAEYVMVETQDGSRYRFHCRMLIDERSRFTRPFESSSFDAVAAGEQVLHDVEAWRTAGTDQQARAAQ